MTVNQTAAQKSKSRQILQPVRGTHDSLPDNSRRFRHIEQTAIEIFGKYGFGEIRTPIFEFTEIFSRNVGDSTDIVTKEMYNFEDRGGEPLTLRPEGTAPVVRAYYSSGLKKDLPLKLCYVGTPMFRYERPQKGRLRQHHQIGAEIFGVSDAMAEVEMLSMAFNLLKKLNISDNLYVQINSLGDSKDRAYYREELLEYLRPHHKDLSAESQTRLERNPLRILDSKDKGDQELIANAPKMFDFLSPASKNHFEKVQAGLDSLGINWQINHNLVRGLDYYTHTVFEIHSEDFGSQSQILSGGRYNGLIAQMGGDDVPAIGFGCGIERLESLMPKLVDDTRPVAIVSAGLSARVESLKIAEKLRNKGISVAFPLEEASFKNQFKKANKANAVFTLIMGEDEFASGICGVKDMETGEQHNIGLTEVVSFVSERI